jgi:hypothetical protein
MSIFGFVCMTGGVEANEPDAAAAVAVESAKHSSRILLRENLVEKL